MSARARWKELCMDTTGGETLGRFWADVLGLTFVPDDEDGALTGESEGHGIAMRRVPEPKIVKHRVHLDVHAESVEALVERGASVVRSAEESGLRWTVMADPEGGEFCAFLRDPDALASYRLYELCVDTADAQHLAQWWGDVLGVPAQSAREEDDDADWWWLEAVPGVPFEGIVFVPVPEPKTGRNRIHWDVYGDVAALEAVGATVLRERDDDIPWDVMADPEGNEFCVFAPQTGGRT